MQIDPTNTATACYTRTTNMMQKFDEAAASFYGPNYDYQDFLNPVYMVIEASNSIVDVIVDCETTNLAKQFSNRFTTWSGLLDFATVIGMSFLKNAVDSNNPSHLWDAGNTFFTAQTCAKTSRALGEMFHWTVFFEIPDDNYSDYLLTDITGE